MKHRLCRWAAALTAMFCSVSAAVCAAPVDGYTIDDTAYTVTITGTPEGLKKNDGILIEILRPGKTVSDGSYIGAQILEDFVFLRQLPADENGGYCVTVNMDGCETGAYPVRINGQTMDRAVFYATPEVKDALLEKIYAIRDSAEPDAAERLAVLLDLKNPLGDAVNMLNLTDPVIFAVSDTALCEILLPLLREAEPPKNPGGDTPAAPEKAPAQRVADKIALAAYIRGLHEECVDIEDYLANETRVLDAATESNRMLRKDYVEAYHGRLTGAHRQDFVQAFFAGKGAASTADVQKRFQTGVTDCLCEKFATWEEVEFLISSFGGDFGVNMETFRAMKTDKKTALYQKILERGGFSNSAAFATFCNSTMATLGNTKNTTGKGGGNGGGKGGSSGAGGGSGFTNAGAVPIPTPEPEPAAVFSDMEAFSWAKKSVETLAGMGIVKGTAEGQFTPARAVTREEFLTMLMRAFSISTEEKSDGGFADVSASDWFYPYVSAAKALGLIEGVGGDMFGVSSSVTREDAAVMAHRIAVYAGRSFDDKAGGSFADDAAISGYARQAVYALKNRGVLGGREDNLFCPKDSCNRAEAAKITDTLLQVRGE